MKNVLCLDPGGTTGFCKAEILGSKVILTVGQSKFNEKSLWINIKWTKPHIIVYEDFEYRNRARTGLDLTPVRLIGVIRLYAQTESVELYSQQASTGKAYYTDEKLKSLKVYKRGVPHGTDALRHFLQWFTFGAGYQYNYGQTFQAEN